MAAHIEVDQEIVEVGYYHPQQELSLYQEVVEVGRLIKPRPIDVYQNIVEAGCCPHTRGGEPGRQRRTSSSGKLSPRVWG